MPARACRLCAAALLVALSASCERRGAATRATTDARPAAEYAGVVLERAEELPAPADAPPRGAAPSATAASAAGAAAFPRACAQRLRDPRDGRVLLLVRSVVDAPTTTRGDTTVTRLERATGDYALLTADRTRQQPPPFLRVDCTNGRAIGWVAPGA